MKIHSGDMVSSPYEDGDGSGGKGAGSFCLRGTLLWRTLVGGGYIEGYYLLVLGDDPRFSRLIVSIRLVEHLHEVNIKYSLMICNFKDKL